MTKHYLNLPQFAARLGLRRDTLAKYKLPDPDITLGTQRARGWSLETIDAWDAARPRPNARRVERAVPAPNPQITKGPRGAFVHVEGRCNAPGGEDGGVCILAPGHETDHFGADHSDWRSK